MWHFICCCRKALLLFSHTQFKGHPQCSAPEAGPDGIMYSRTAQQVGAGFLRLSCSYPASLPPRLYAAVVAMCLIRASHFQRHVAVQDELSTTHANSLRCTIKCSHTQLHVYMKQDKKVLTPIILKCFWIKSLNDA